MLPIGVTPYEGNNSEGRAFRNVNLVTKQGEGGAHRRKSSGTAISKPNYKELAILQYTPTFSFSLASRTPIARDKVLHRRRLKGSHGEVCGNFRGERSTAPIGDAENGHMDQPVEFTTCAAELELGEKGRDNVFRQVCNQPA